MILIIGVCGEPATGKTTLMRLLMDKLGENWTKERFGVLDHLKSGNIYVLGKYDGEDFDGTDKLSMSVINDAESFIKSLPVDSIVLFEGDRLFCSRFINFIQQTGKTLLIQLINSSIEEQNRRSKREDNGINQSETFLKGRKTKYKNLRQEFPLIQPMNNDNLESRDLVVEKIIKFIGLKGNIEQKPNNKLFSFFKK